MYRNNRERSDAHFTQFFPMITYCKTIVPYHKVTDMDTIKIQNVFLTTRIPRVTLLLCCCSVAVMSNSFVTPWTIACQAPLFMGFPRQEYWSGLPLPPRGESSRPRNQTQVSCILCIGRWIYLFTTEPRGEPFPPTR